MESLTVDSKVHRATVKIISQERLTNVGKMHANLVSPTRMKLDIYKFNLTKTMEHTITSMGILARGMDAMISPSSGRSSAPDTKA